MARYEGMDELLQRVRQRLSGGTREADSSESAPLPHETAAHDQSYGEILSEMMLLLRDAEQLGELLASENARSFSQDQQDQLRALLGKVLHQLRLCQEQLQRVTHHEVS